LEDSEVALLVFLEFLDGRFSPVDAGPDSNAKVVVKRYPRDASVTAHFHPEHPDRAALETSLTRQWARILILLNSLPLDLWYRGVRHRVMTRSQAEMADR
jgi:hypothetical protein